MAVESIKDVKDAMFIASRSERGARMEVTPEAATAAWKRLDAFEQVLALVNPMSLGDRTGLLLEIHDIIVKAIK